MKDSPTFRLAMGYVVRSHRERQKLTRKQLAEIIGGSISHIKAIEVGNTNLTMTVFVLVANALDIPAPEMLHEVLQRQAFLDQKDI